MKKILLIGGGGYVGTVITDFFLRQNISVNVLDNFIYDHKLAVKKFISNKKFNLIEGDFCDLKKLDLALKDVSEVIFLGGLVGDPITKKYKDLNQKNNIDGIKDCINYLNSKRINKLIFVSTCSNYGIIPQNALAHEEYELKPLSLYAKAKVEIEKFILKNKTKYIFDSIILRFATAFGLSERMRFDLTVNEFTLDLLEKKTLEVYDPDTWRPYCHVKDFAKIMMKILEVNTGELKSEIFNCGSNSNNHTKRDIVNIIKSKIDNANIKFKEGDTDPRNYRVDFTKLEKKFSFTPDFNVSDGVQEIIDNRNLFLGKEKKYFGNYEIKKKN